MLFPFASLNQVQGFFWVVIRVGVIVFFLPLFGARGIPTMWKAGFALLLSLILTPLIRLPGAYPQTVPTILMGMASEVLLGFVLAFGVRFLITTVQMAGSFMSFQMGLSMARVLDPNEGVQSDTLSELLYLFMILFFFAVDGHHIFIRGIVASFEEIPLHGFELNPRIHELIIQSGGRMFLIALKIAAPIMIALFLSNLCLGIVARTVPQINILMIGFPINITLGLVIFILVLNSSEPLMLDLFRQMGDYISNVIRTR